MWGIERGRTVHLARILYDVNLHFSISSIFEITAIFNFNTESSFSQVVALRLFFLLLLLYPLISLLQADNISNDRFRNRQLLISIRTEYVWKKDLSLLCKSKIKNDTHSIIFIYIKEC